MSSFVVQMCSALKQIRYMLQSMSVAPTILHVFKKACTDLDFEGSFGQISAFQCKCVLLPLKGRIATLQTSLFQLGVAVIWLELQREKAPHSQEFFTPRFHIHMLQLIPSNSLLVVPFIICSEGSNRQNLNEIELNHL